MHTMVTDGSSRLKPGMELVLTRWIALSGTAKLAEEKEAELLKRFPEIWCGKPGIFPSWKTRKRR